LDGVSGWESGKVELTVRVHTRAHLHGYPPPAWAFLFFTFGNSIYHFLFVIQDLEEAARVNEVQLITERSRWKVELEQQRDFVIREMKHGIYKSIEEAVVGEEKQKRVEFKREVRCWFEWAYGIGCRLAFADVVVFVWVGLPGFGCRLADVGVLVGLFEWAYGIGCLVGWCGCVWVVVFVWVGLPLGWLYELAGWLI
jgi:hypothetical protein